MKSNVGGVLIKALLIPALLLGAYLIYDNWIHRQDVSIETLLQHYKPGTSMASIVGDQSGAKILGDVIVEDFDDKIVLHFGNFTVPVSKKELFTKAMMDNLARLEIAIKVDEKGKLEFYWRGNKVN